LGGLQVFYRFAHFTIRFPRRRLTGSSLARGPQRQGAQDLVTLPDIFTLDNRFNQD
jgi:hypothetical protein